MDEKDTLTLVGVGALFLGGGGLTAVLGSIIPPVQATLVDWGILVAADSALVEIPGTGLGPSVTATLIALGLICLLIVIAPVLRKANKDES